MSEPAGGSPSGLLPSLLFEKTACSRATSDEADDDHSFERDLNLDQVIFAVARGREESGLITRVLSGPLLDPSAVRYRHEVFRDLEDSALRTAVRDFARRMSEVSAHLRQLGDMPYRYQREGWLLDTARDYCEVVQAVAGHLASAQLDSPGLQGLRGYLTAYVSSPAFRSLCEDTRDTKTALGRIRYCTRIRGLRVEVSRYQGEPDYSAAVLATFERFRQDPPKDYRVTYRTRPGMNHVADQIARIVATLFPEEFTALQEYCRCHASFADEGVLLAAREFQFYLAYLDFIEPLRDAGLNFCYPEVSASSKEVSAEDTFDLALASKLVAVGTPVVTNGFRLDGSERILVVTGPNQGGKTTFARTFGQLHHLAGTGCPVPGSAARLFLPDRIFTQFEREEDLANMRGKLEDDLLRIAEILRAATSRSVVILNETFASTTLQDARFLGTKLLTRVMQLDALCVYITFVDELASLGEQVVSMMSTVVPENPAERTFKVVRKPADGLAYALAIAAKHDLTYDRLRERLAQ